MLKDNAEHVPHYFNSLHITKINQSERRCIFLKNQIVSSLEIDASYLLKSAQNTNFCASLLFFSKCALFSLSKLTLNSDDAKQCFSKLDDTSSNSEF